LRKIENALIKFFANVVLPQNPYELYTISFLIDSLDVALQKYLIKIFFIIEYNEDRDKTKRGSKLMKHPLYVFVENIIYFSWFWMNN
jgi:hypothetical protein